MLHFTIVVFHCLRLISLDNSDSWCGYMCICVHVCGCCYCKTIKIAIVYYGLYSKWKRTPHKADSIMEKNQRVILFGNREVVKNEQ